MFAFGKCISSLQNISFGTFWQDLIVLSFFPIVLCIEWSLRELAYITNICCSGLTWIKPRYWEIQRAAGLSPLFWTNGISTEIFFYHRVCQFSEAALIDPHRQSHTKYSHVQCLTTCCWWGLRGGWISRATKPRFIWKLQGHLKPKRI